MSGTGAGDPGGGPDRRPGGGPDDGPGSVVRRRDAAAGLAPLGLAARRRVAAPPGVERRIALVLRVGTSLGVGLLAVGALLLVLDGTSPLATGWPPLDLRALPADLAALRPAGFLWAGLLATIATPLLRVGAASLGFARAGERRMAALGLAALVVIGVGVVVGASGR